MQMECSWGIELLREIDQPFFISSWTQPVRRPFSVWDKKEFLLVHEVQWGSTTAIYFMTFGATVPFFFCILSCPVAVQRLLWQFFCYNGGSLELEWAIELKWRCFLNFCHFTPSDKITTFKKVARRCKKAVTIWSKRTKTADFHQKLQELDKRWDHNFNICTEKTSR